MRVLLTLAAALLSSLGPSLATAMQCRPQSPERMAVQARIAFVGRVLSIESDRDEVHEGICRVWTPETPKCGSKVVEFEVLDKLKGDVEDRVVVTTQDSCYCLGARFEEGSEYLVIASDGGTGSGGQLVARGGCSGTGRLGDEETKQMLEQLARQSRQR